MWDRRQKTSNPIFSVKEMEDYVSSMLTNEDKKYLVCSSGDGTLTTLNMRGKQLHVQVKSNKLSLNDFSSCTIEILLFNTD